MEAVEVKDSYDCRDTTCDDYSSINDKEEFCNEFASTSSSPESTKESCITSYGYIGCGLETTVNVDDAGSCTYNASSFASDIFSAKGRKQSLKSVYFQGIYLKEICDYEENIEMRSSGSRYAFVNTLTVNNGRNCKYSIYDKEILQNQMATIFRPDDQPSMDCSENKYCEALSNFYDKDHKPNLNPSEVKYSSRYSVNGVRENGTRIFETYNFNDNGEKFQMESELSEPKDHL